MTPTALVADGFERVQQLVEEIVDGLSVDQLAWQPAPASNPIGWLIWHLSRVQDSHMSEASGEPQVWAERGWPARLQLPYPPDATGYGHSSQEVAALRVEAGALTEYHDQVHEATSRFLDGVQGEDLERIVDRRWDPPVTLATRLVSVLSDGLQHAGQAAYVRGLLERSSA